MLANFFGIFPKCSIFWNGTVKFAISKKFASSQVQIWDLEVRSSSSPKSSFATQAILDMHGTRTTEHRIVHHDLKPDNILLGSNFQGLGAGMYVVDFGLARMDVDEKGNQSRALKPWKESYYTKVSYGTDSYKCPQLCWL